MATDTALRPGTTDSTAGPTSGSTARRGIGRLVGGLNAAALAVEAERLRHSLAATRRERDEARRDLRAVVARVTELEYELAAARSVGPAADGHHLAA